jgi:hypothetical protein
LPRASLFGLRVAPALVKGQTWGRDLATTNPVPVVLGRSLKRVEGPQGQLKIKATCGRGHRPQVGWGRILKSLIEMMQATKGAGGGVGGALSTRSAK